MSSSKPAIVIVPGAFYEKWHYRVLHNGLEQAGYNVTTAVLPSTGNDKPEPNFDNDIAIISAAIESYISAQQDVVLVMHSYGGLVGNCACKGLLPSDTPNGKRVVGLVHVCSGVPFEGMSLMDTTSGVNFPWSLLVPENAKPNTGIYMTAKEPGKLFFHDCSSETREEAVKRLSYWSEGCLWSKATFAAFTRVESHYLVCTADRALPAEMQEQFCTVEGGKWKNVEKIESGHSPFLSRPEETVEFVRRCCGEEL